ncbi:MAG: hypothetical protein AVDCRST_MAG56-7295 [uncultured Cytophagales bacterium]|uniref:Uncharacterized protein n=1 Tax=uncultured Cytophagales bacterium TaxID=158755 RepID=A0A6J4LCS2_9SPHI|nr:MAG: hypothetical protein AVDCRST_MAG56-7295 [uncultured Cytophagales bacterium]
MKTTMLAYSKLILSKVSFSEALFEKELKKALATLSGGDRLHLGAWCSRRFGGKYRKIANRSVCGGKAQLKPLQREYAG